MNSMTGFGAATAPLNNASVRVEIGGVNRKQTEIAISLPRAWAELETRVREIVAGCVSRGRVNVTISLQAATAAAGNLSVNTAKLAALQDAVAATYISDTVITYAVQLIAATRSDAYILRGASPRATLSVIEMAKAVAQLRGRDYVVPSDVSEVFLQTVEHRILMKQNAEAEGITAADALRKILSSTPAPALR